MKLFPQTRKFISYWIEDTIPRVKKLAIKAKEEFKQIYKEAKEDYEAKKKGTK